MPFFKILDIQKIEQIIDLVHDMIMFDSRHYCINNSIIFELPHSS